MENLQLIKKEIDNGGVFIGEYKAIYEIIKNIIDIRNIPFSLTHHKIIKIKKINNDYIINPCK